MREYLPPTVNVVCDDLLFEDGRSIVDAATAGITDVTSMMRSKLDVRIIGPKWGEGDYESTQWFVDRAYISEKNATELGPDYKNLAGKVAYDVMRQDIADDPYRRIAPHLGYMLLSRNLTAADGRGYYMNFVFGITSRPLRQSVQSVYKYFEAGLDDETLLRATRLVARHEFGHLIGLDTDNIVNRDRRKGALFDGHCVNVCTMQQMESVNLAIVQSERLAGQPDAGFCSDCTSFVESR